MANTPSGSAYEHASDVYPYNIVPQVHSPKPSGPMPKLKCPPDNAQQFIIFDSRTLAVIRGWEWKANFDLREMFIPCDSYQAYEFTLKYTGDFTSYITLNYGNMGDPINGVQFICIFPQYQDMELDDQNKWKIHWRYLDDPLWTAAGYAGDGYNTPSSPEDETTWRQLGRILMMNGTADVPIKPIHLQNRMGEDIQIKMLIGN